MMPLSLIKIKANISKKLKRDKPYAKNSCQTRETTSAEIAAAGSATHSEQLPTHNKN